MKLEPTNRAGMVKTAKKSAPKQTSRTPKTEAVVADDVQISSLKPAAKTTGAGKTAALKEQGLTTALEANVSSSLPASIAVPVASSFKDGFVEGYLTPKEIRGRCEKLAKEFPHLVEFIDTGIMTHGYDGKQKDVQGPSELFYLRLGPKTSDRDKKVGVFQFAAAHARERINPMSMMELTEQLVHNYDPSSTDPKVKANTDTMNELDIFVAINTNPDGHNYAAYDDPMWRKNRRPAPSLTGNDWVEPSTNNLSDWESVASLEAEIPQGDGSYAHQAQWNSVSVPLENVTYSDRVGVDVNRNYPYKWTASNDPSSQIYSGAGPASEPETQALLAVTKNHPNIMFVVDWHSYGQEIRQPLGASPADQEFYGEMHGRVQDAMRAVGGNEYETVVSQVTQGSSDDHFYHNEHVYSTVMETGLEFTPPEHEALQVKEESVAGAREFFEVAQDYQKSLNNDQG